MFPTSFWLFIISFKGTYKGCGHTYTSTVQADHALDPIDPTPLTPWQASHGFTASVQGLDANSQYTLVIQDAGLFYLHGVYINIPGAGFNIENGEVCLFCAIIMM